MFAFLYIWIPDNDVISSIYAILNSLQGVFIYLAFGLSNRVRKMWEKKLQRENRDSKTAMVHLRSGYPPQATNSTGSSTGKELQSSTCSTREASRHNSSSSAEY